ncbi:hypothetical protein CCR97_09680 [Rhodoplanes elegans]|uniref:Cytosolic protein n=1 Tax=Rhodoplanes elegans TaxID=29408 RepID=A0A327KQQ3_9BRAD|nr:DUF6282 family protein [Rhodoplanes elegans]MBK5958474.1 hypothetical protein [Rhodoplanes elegans]RAI39685.1 hypothetical protein CH338_08705 [Rhodoplanes elegans]
MTATDTTASIEARIDSLLVGAVDPHVHSGPSIAPRGLDHLALVRQMSEAGFAAVITKDHDYAGVATAALITANFPELRTRIFSGIALNNAVGGLNPWAVEHTAAMGGKIVFMPTLAAEHHLRWEKTSAWSHPASTSKMRPAVGVPVVDPNGKVRDDTKVILDIVARTGLVLASGHLHISETWAVFEEAKRRGVETMVLTHPEDIVEATLDDVRGLVSLGAHVEHSLCMFIEGSKFKTRTGEDLKAQIDAAGVDRTIMCSDLGQTGVYSPLEGFRRGIRLCMDLGYTDADIRKMVATNAARVFRLEPEQGAVATPRKVPVPG